MEIGRHRAVATWKPDFLEIKLEDPLITGHQMLPAMVFPGLVIRQGSEFRQVIKWVDTHGTPVDISAYTARMKIKDRPGGTEYASWASGAELTLASDGTITIDVAAATTAAFTFTRAMFDLELVDGSSNVVALAEGTVALYREATA